MHGINTESIYDWCTLAFTAHELMNKFPSKLFANPSLQLCKCVCGSFFIYQMFDISPDSSKAIRKYWQKKREKQDRTIDIRDDLSISLANIASLDSMNCRYFETYTFCVNVQTSQNPICYCQRIYTSASHCGCTQFQFEWRQYVQVIREFIVGANCMITTLLC